MKKGTSLDKARLEGFFEGEQKMLARLKRQIEFWESELNEDIRLAAEIQGVSK